MAALAAVAMRGERRVPLRVFGEALDKAFFEEPLRRRLFPSFLGVLRMLKAIDWRRSACGEGWSGWTLPHCPPPRVTLSPQLTCLTTAVAAFFSASVVLCLRPSCRSRGVRGRAKQLVAFLDYREDHQAGGGGKQTSHSEPHGP